MYQVIYIAAPPEFDPDWWSETAEWCECDEPDYYNGEHRCLKCGKEIENSNV